MTELSNRASSKQSNAEAIQWHVRSQTSSFAPEDQGQLQEWLTQSPGNARSFQHVESFCHAIDRLDETQLQELITLKDRPKPFSKWLSGLAVAAVAAGLVIGLWWFMGEPYPGADYTSAIGETRTMTLADGSVVELNTDTAIKVELSSGKRQITLLGGEAFFTVAPDPSRPFEVVVKQGTIRALGTAFNVRTDGQGTTISVQEHAVRVSSTRQKTSQDLSQGQRVQVDHEGNIGAAEPYDEHRLLAWRRQRLIFEHQSLTEVITEMNRYRPGIMIPIDSKLRGVTVTGAFDTTRIDEALRTIESALPVKTVRITDRLVLLFHSSASH